MLGWGGGGGVGVFTFCLVRTLHISTLPRSLECLPCYMLLRCRDLWNACHVTCCYAAEISGMLAMLHVATLPRSLECLPRYMLLRCRDLWNAFHVACYYAAEISGMLAIFVWVPVTKISCYMPKCGNGASSMSTRTCSRRLQTCCTSSSEKKNASFCPIEMKQQCVFYCGKNNISPKNTQIWTSKFVTFSMTQIVTSLW